MVHVHLREARMLHKPFAVPRRIDYNIMSEGEEHDPKKKRDLCKQFFKA